MRRDIAFEQKVKDLLHRGECATREQAEFKTRVREGYARLGEIAKSATHDRESRDMGSEEAKRKAADEFRKRALNPQRVHVQNFFDTPR